MVSLFRYTNISDLFDWNNRKVIIWGLSVSALNAYIKLTGKGANVIGFTDSFQKEKGKLFAGLRVYSLEEMEHISEICGEKIGIFISTVNTDYLRKILAKTDKIENVDVYCEKEVHGAGHYDIERMKDIVEKKRDKISFVRDNLFDEKSKLSFEKLLDYRLTNNEGIFDEIYEKDHYQYFPDADIFTFKNDEVFIDCGAFDGFTSYEFATRVDGKYEHIFLMEPDERLYRVTSEFVKLKQMRNAEVIKKGAFSSNTVVTFKNDFATGSSNISSGGDECIETIKIDDMLAGKRASYIKMDIEGAEREALLGAKETISQYHPKLAISIYHQEDDLWEIPNWLMESFPFYNYYIRHYSSMTNETVLYAIPKE